MRSPECGPDGCGAAKDRQVWLNEHSLKQVEKERFITLSMWGLRSVDGSALKAELAKLRDISEEGIHIKRIHFGGTPWAYGHSLYYQRSAGACWTLSTDSFLSFDTPYLTEGTLYLTSDTVCVFSLGVFRSSRVTRACPVTTELIMRANVRTKQQLLYSGTMRTV